MAKRKSTTRTERDHQRIYSKYAETVRAQHDLRVRAAEIEAAWYEAKWGGLRSILLLALISGTMVMMLVAGTMS